MRPALTIFIILHLLFRSNAFGQVYGNAYIDSLIATLPELKEDSLIANNLILISLKLFDFDPNEGLRYGFEGLRLSEKLNWKKAIAHAKTAIGNNYCYGLSDFTNAIKYVKEAVQLCEELGDDKKLAELYSMLGSSYNNQNQFERALEFYLKSLKLAEKIAYWDQLVTTQSNLGTLYFRMSNFTKAKEYYEAALSYYKSVDDKRAEARLLLNLSNVYYAQHDYVQTFDCLDRSLIIFEDLGNRRGISGILLNMGSNYMGLPDSAFLQMGLSPDDRYPKALEYNFKGLKICRELNFGYNTSICYYNISESYYNLVKKNVDPFLKSKFDGNKSEVLSLAESYMDSSISILQTIGAAVDLADAYYLLSGIRELRGNYKGALESHKKHIEIRDTALNLDKERKLMEMSMQFEFEKKELIYKEEQLRKEQEIALANRENEIKSLRLNQQEVVLRNSRLEAEKNHTQILLLNTSNELQQISLTKTQKELAQQQAEAKAKAAELEVINKDKQLKEQQLEKQKLQRNGILLGTGLVSVMVLLAFRSIQLRRKLEKQQAVSQERRRISADLHDDIGSGLSRISLLSERVKSDAQSPEAKAEALKISQASQELSENISEIIWALNTNNDYLENLVAYIRRYASEYFENSSIRLKVTAPESIPALPISGEVRRNIFYTVKEALHNIIKHSKATFAELKVTVHGSRFAIEISDNGKGIPETELNQFGNGLVNMRNRMKTIHGNCEVINGKGTTIALSVRV